jgi:hypothetical protein
MRNIFKDCGYDLHEFWFIIIKIHPTEAKHVSGNSFLKRLSDTINKKNTSIFNIDFI